MVAGTRTLVERGQLYIKESDLGAQLVRANEVGTRVLVLDQPRISIARRYNVAKAILSTIGDVEVSVMPNTATFLLRAFQAAGETVFDDALLAERVPELHPRRKQIAKGQLLPSDLINYTTLVCLTPLDPET